MRELSLRLVDDDDQWDQACSASPSAGPFHTASFLRTTAASLGRELVLLGVAHRGLDIGGIPLVVDRDGRVATANWDPVVQGVGPALDRRWQREALAAAHRCVPGLVGLELYDSRAEVGPFPDHPTVRSAWWTQRLETYVLEVAGRSDEEMFARTSRTTRRHLKKVAALTATEATDSELVDELPRWVDAAFSRTGHHNGLAAYQKNYVAEVVTAMRGRWPVRALAVQDRGHTVCLTVMMARGRRAHFWHMASDPDHTSMSPGYAAYRETWRWAREQGCHDIDLQLAPTPGLVQLKRGLGAVPEPLYRHRREWLPLRLGRLTAHAATKALASEPPGS